MLYYFVGTLLQPYTFLMCVLLAVLVVLWRRQRPRPRSLRVAVAVFALLWLVSTPLVSYLTVGSLEWQFSALQGFPEDAQAIVVLTGGMRVYGEQGERVELGGDTAFRAMHGAELYQRAGRCLVVPSGGKVFAEVPGPTLAQGAGDFLLRLGVAREDLLLEDQSRTTYENATCCRDLLAKREIRRIVLVTDASHMPRALRCFRAAGFDVVPAPCNYRTNWFQLSPGEFLPCPDAAAGMGAAGHEWLGLVWYWLHGRI